MAYFQDPDTRAELIKDDPRPPLPPLLFGALPPNIQSQLALAGRGGVLLKD